MIETVPSGTILHGHYRVERVLGSGGFGHVYLAIDLTTSQQYAIKEYLVTGASGQEQLKHEATVLSRLHHANLPAFQDAFMERGRYYVVLNYIEGNDLTDLIRVARQRNDTIPIVRIMNWILAICDAVHFLHSQQPPVIHRDIKPDNIRITSNGTAILVDLGNAKAAADGARTLFFIRHQGTPGYAPPEQYPGGSGTDTRSDVYALGGTLYFALTSQEPPSVSTRNQYLQQGRADLPTLQEQLANNPPEDSPEANAARQFRLGVTKPSKPAPRHSKHVAQLGTLPPEVLSLLNRVIHRAMAMKPKDRYQSIADFANDLKRVMSAMPTPPQTPPTPPSRPVDTNSTQPDLPMLYETMQAAKDNTSNTQGMPDAQGSNRVGQTPSPRVSPATATIVCPRCNTVLPTGTQFCTRCGASLSTSADLSAQRGSSGQKLVLGPQPRQIPTPVRTSSPRPTSSPSSTHQQVNRGGASAPQPAAMTAAPPLSAKSSHSQPPSSSSSGPASFLFFGLSQRIWLVIFIAAVLIILLLISMFVAFNQGHHSQTLLHFSAGLQWLNTKTQAVSYRNVLLLISSTPATFRLWRHNPGLPLSFVHSLQKSSSLQ